MFRRAFLKSFPWLWGGGAAASAIARSTLAQAEAPARNGGAPATVTLANVSALRALTSASAGAAVLLGYRTPGDGGGGAFVRAPGEGGADNGVTLIVDAAGGRWRRVHSGPIDVRWAGARCDGVADDAAAVRAAARAGPISFEAGVCHIASDLAIAVPASVVAGQVKPASGATVAFEGGFSAPPRQVFLNATAGEGRIAIDPRTTPEGYPEWWGAAANDPSPGQRAVNTAALQAALDCLQTTRLGAGVYHTDATLYMRKDGARLIGSGVTWEPGDKAASMIAYSRGSGDILQVGPADQPRSFWDFQHDCHLQAFTVWRTAPPVADRPDGPGQGYFNSPSGIRVQWTQNTVLRDVGSIDNCHGIYVKGNNNIYCKYVTHIRKTPGPRPEYDFNHCIFQDNSVNYGFDSGNASIYFENCSSFGYPPSEHSHGREWTGHYTFGGLTDTFICRLETANHDFGLQANGAGEEDATYSAEDFHVIDCVLDACASAAIQINGVNRGTQITIVGCYLCGAGAGDGLRVQNASGGLVTMTACQLISGPGSTGAGIRLVGSPQRPVQGVNTRDNVLTDWLAPEVYDHAANCRSSNQINVFKQAPRTAAIHVLGSNAGRMVIEPLITSSIGADVPVGVLIEPGADHLEVRCTNIDPNALAGASGRNKVVYAGTPVTTPNGAFAAHSIVQGLMS